MLEQTITVKLPVSLIDKLKRAAAMTYRSVDEVLITAINASFVAPPGLPDELADELAAMRLLSDQALQAALFPSLAPAEQQRLQQLNQAAGERSLTAAETTEQAALLAGYHRSVLRRAQALAILAERGHAIDAQDI